MTDPQINALLQQIIDAGTARGWHEKDILARAGLGKTTLSKIKRSGDTRMSTLSRLANTVGLKLTLASNNPTVEQILQRRLFSPDERHNVHVIMV